MLRPEDLDLIFSILFGEKIANKLKRFDQQFNSYLKERRWRLYCASNRGPFMWKYTTGKEHILKHILLPMIIFAGIPVALVVISMLGSK